MTLTLTAVRRRWRRLLEQVRCFAGQHRETVVYVAAELRLVCLDCPHATTLGRVCLLGSNYPHHHDEP